MPVPNLDPCIGPIGFVCDLVSDTAASAQAAASEYVLGGIANAFVHAAAQLGELALSVLNSSTAVDFSAQWLQSNVAVLAAVTLPVLVGLFVVQVATSGLRREAGGLARAVAGSALALAVTQLALTAVDEICEAIASAAGTTVADAAGQSFKFAVLTSAASPGLALIIAVLLCLGFLLLWGVLLFRKAALILIAVFAPWPTGRFVHWSGVEAATAMHQDVAANTVNRGARATGRQAQFAAQHAVPASNAAVKS